ncbi:hypothetical protein TNCV_3077991 [Trichonephila clavipes]|nr:hypothetical protein TNCV_3077991 [Trichonephila clavipes]
MLSLLSALVTLTDLAVGKSWSRLLDGQRHAQLSALPRVEGVACFRIITGHDYLQAHLFKIGLADSPLCPLCKSRPMTGDIYPIVPLYFMFSGKTTVEFSFLLERHLLYIGLQDALCPRGRWRAQFFKKTFITKYNFFSKRLIFN